MIPFLLFIIACLISTVIGLAYFLNYEGSQAAKLRTELEDKERSLENLRALHCEKNSEAAKRIRELTDKWVKVSNYYKKLLGRYKILRDAIQIHKEEIDRRDVVIEDLQEEIKQANAALETVKGAVDHYFHNEE